MQDIITTEERVQQFERMQALQLWMIPEVSESESHRGRESHSEAVASACQECGEIFQRG